MTFKMYELLEKESRSFEVTRRSITKNFIFLIESEQFLELAETQEVVDVELSLTLDDAIFNKLVLPYFISIAPVTYQFYVDEEEYIFLYLSSMRVEQINWKQWKMYCVFDIPEDNGESAGGGGGETGASDGEANSEQFTQLSFNCDAVFENRQVGYLTESHRKLADGWFGNIRDAFKYQPIGETEEGIDGYEQPVRNFSFEITQYMPPTKLTYKYMRRLSRLVTALNKDVFFGFAPGSVMCTGANGAGNLYQNVPVTIRFDVRPNFRILNSGARSIAALEDVYETVTNPWNGQQSKQVVTSTQYDTYVDDTFGPTMINYAAAPAGSPVKDIPLPSGIHSGWSIVSLRFEKEIKTTEKAIVRIPTDRFIYLPEDVIFVNFREFLL